MILVIASNMMKCHESSSKVWRTLIIIYSIESSSQRERLELCKNLPRWLECSHPMTTYSMSSLLCGHHIPSILPKALVSSVYTVEEIDITSSSSTQIGKLVAICTPLLLFHLIYTWSSCYWVHWSFPGLIWSMRMKQGLNISCMESPFHGISARFPLPVWLLPSQSPFQFLLFSLTFKCSSSARISSGPFGFLLCSYFILE